MKDQENKYKLFRERDGELWINLPNNGGDIGGLDEIVLVLNQQHDKILELERELKQFKYDN